MIKKIGILVFLLLLAGTVFSMSLTIDVLGSSHFHTKNAFPIKFTAVIDSTPISNYTVELLANNTVIKSQTLNLYNCSANGNTYTCTYSWTPSKNDAYNIAGNIKTINTYETAGLTAYLLHYNGYAETTSLDTGKPTISFVDLSNGAILKGTVVIKIEAKDGTKTVLPESTKLYLNNKILTSTNGKGYAERVGETFIYQMEINTKNFADGEYQLKAITNNRLEYNPKEGTETITVTLQNKYDFAGKIIKIQEIEKEIETLFKNFTNYGLDCSTVAELKTALGETIYATINAGENEKTFIENENRVNNLYSQIKGKLVLEPIKTIAGNENYEKITMTDIDLKDIIANRIISFYNAKVGDKETKVASFKLRVSNNSSETKTVKIVEKIPKEFANSASQISSEIGFTVIEEDPIIMWEIQLNPGEQKDITYSINNSGFTDEQVNNAETLFNTKPTVIDSALEVTKALFTEGIETISVTSAQNPITGLFYVVGVANQSGILNIIAVILGIALIAFAFSKVKISAKIDDGRGKFAYRDKNK